MAWLRQLAAAILNPFFDAYAHEVCACVCTCMSVLPTAHAPAAGGRTAPHDSAPLLDAHDWLLAAEDAARILVMSLDHTGTSAVAVAASGGRLGQLRAQLVQPLLDCVAEAPARLLYESSSRVVGKDATLHALLDAVLQLLLELARPLAPAAGSGSAGAVPAAWRGLAEEVLAAVLCRIVNLAKSSGGPNSSQSQALEALACVVHGILAGRSGMLAAPERQALLQAAVQRSVVVGELRHALQASA